jgi:clan AA aspartic protease (TIGR02281 family)
MRLLALFVAIWAAMAVPALAESCQLKRYGVVPFETDSTSHIYINVTIGGHPARLMLDTGAFWSIIGRGFADSKGFRIGNAEGLELFDAAGERITKTTIAELRIGGLSYGQTEFFLSGFPVPDADSEVGVLGQNLLAKVDLEIDNAGKKLSFFSQEHCKGAGVYWADEAVTLKFKKQSARSAIGSNIKKYDPNQIDMPIVAAELDGEVISVLFDTGATYSVLDIDHAKRRFGITPNTPGVKPSGKLITGNGVVVDAYTYRFEALTIAGIKFENIPVRLAKLDGLKQMLLGMNEMKHLRLYFAPKDGMIHVTAADAGRTQ